MDYVLLHIWWTSKCIPLEKYYCLTTDGSEKKSDTQTTSIGWDMIYEGDEWDGFEHKNMSLQPPLNFYWGLANVQTQWCRTHRTQIVGSSQLPGMIRRETILWTHHPICCRGRERILIIHQVGPTMERSIMGKITLMGHIGVLQKGGQKQDGLLFLLGGHAHPQ